MVAFLVTGLPHSEHFGGIAKELICSGEKVIFLVSNQKLKQAYKNHFPDSPVLLARVDLIEYLNFFSVGHATTHYIRFHSDVVSILNSQGLLDPIQNYYYSNRQKADSLIGARTAIDYLVAHTQSMFDAYKKLLNPVPNPLKIIKGGYPSLDSYIREYKAFNNDLEKEEKTLIVGFTISHVESSSIEEECDICGLSPRLINELIETLLEKYRVVFRPHPESDKSLWMEDIVNHFSSRPNFIYDTSARLSPALMNEALTLITNQSSIGQTFPLTTCKKSIIYIPNQDFYHEMESIGAGIVNEKIHYLAHCKEDILKAIHKIEMDKTAKEEIEEYRSKEIFNLGESNRAIASFIKEILDRQDRSQQAIEKYHG